MKIGIDYIAEDCIISDGKSYVMKIQGKDKPLVKGNTLKSRKYEVFIRDFIQEAINCILNFDYQKIYTIFKAIESSLESKSMDLSKLSQRQTLSTSLDEYVSKVETGGRNRDGAYEIALRSDVPMGVGDVVQFYVSEPPWMIREYKTRPNKVVRAKKAKFELAKAVKEYDNDYYVEHYVERLHTVTKNVFYPIFREQFKQIFPDLELKKDDDRKLTKKLQQLDNYEIN